MNLKMKTSQSILVTIVLISNQVLSKPSLRSSKSEAAKLLDQVKTETKSARDFALENIDKYSPVIQETTNTVFENGSRVLQYELDSFTAILDRIKEEAAQLNLDISQCLYENEDKIYDLKEDGLISLETCANGMYETIGSLVVGAKKQVMNMYKIVLNIERVFNLCPDDDAACYDHVIKMLQENDLVQIIKNDLQYAESSISYVIGLIIDCENSSAYEAQDKGYNIIFTIRDCVNNLR